MSQKKMALKDLSFNNVGVWPQQYKVVFCAIIGSLIVGLVWWLFVRDQRAELAVLERTEGDLRSDDVSRMRHAADRDTQATANIDGLPPPQPTLPHASSNDSDRPWAVDVLWGEPTEYPSRGIRARHAVREHGGTCAAGFTLPPAC